MHHRNGLNMLSAGMRVKAGQPLITLSAMKMETSVAASCAGVVRHVAVDPQDTVEAGQSFCLGSPYAAAVDAVVQ